MSHRCVHSYEAFYPALKQEMRIGIEEICVVPVSHRQEKETMLSKISLDSTDDHRAVGVADLLGDNSDCEGALDTKRTGKKVRPII